MTTDLPLRCECGALRGVLRGASPRGGNRVVCYCDDCQAWAHFLDRAGSVLDAHGGTDVFQTSPARVAITGGAEQLACARLRPGGLVRWYSGCCRTPLGNTLASRIVPFVGLVRRGCLGVAGAGPSGEEALGPVRARVFGRFARGDRSQLGAHDRVPPSQILRLAALALAAAVRGDSRRSPFFGPSGELAATPRVLAPEELAAVEAARDRA